MNLKKAEPMDLAFFRLKLKELFIYRTILSLLQKPESTLRFRNHFTISNWF